MYSVHYMDDVMTDKQLPSKRRFNKTRQGILDAARDILIEQGMEALSMRTLAEKVDYSPSALYKYFKNKEDILDALREEAWELSAQFQNSYIKPGMSAPELLYQMGLAYIGFARAYPAQYQLLMSPSDNELNSIDDLINYGNFKALIDFISEGVAKGDFHLPEGYEPKHLAFLSWFMANGVSMAMISTMRGCQPEFEKIAAQSLRLLTEVFTRK